MLCKPTDSDFLGGGEKGASLAELKFSAVSLLDFLDGQP
jgi:hypothetical protein